MSPAVALVISTAVMGLAATWPARHRFGLMAWNLAAGPVGLVAWVAPVLAGIVLGSGWSPGLVTCSLAAYVGVVAVGMWVAAGCGEKRHAEDVRDSHFIGSAALHLAMLAGLGALVSASGISVYSYDSWAEVQFFGWQVLGSSMDPVVPAWRGVIAPALHAADAFLGGEWPIALYPSIAAYTVGWLAHLSWRTFGEAGFSRRSRVAFSGLTSLALVSTPAFLFHTVYVHTHMLSALMLLVAVAGVSRAWQEGRAHAPVWILLVGIAALGLALGRPDGLAYVFAVHVVIGSGVLLGRLRIRATLWYLAPFLGGATALYGSLVARFGLFVPQQRLSATGTLATLAASWLFAIALWSGARVLASGRGAVSARALWTGLLALDAGALVVAASLKPADFELTVLNATANLAWEGGYNSLWLWVALVLCASGAAIVVRVVRADSFPAVLQLAIVQFAVIALVVHALVHPGRIAWFDSLSRVAFHVLPLVLWLFVLVLARVWVASGFRSPGQHEDVTTT